MRNGARGPSLLRLAGVRAILEEALTSNTGHAAIANASERWDLCVGRRSEPCRHLQPHDRALTLVPNANAASAFSAPSQRQHSARGHSDDEHPCHGPWHRTIGRLRPCSKLIRATLLIVQARVQ